MTVRDPEPDLAADATVIICAYSTRRWGDLCSAISAVQRQTLAPRQIILVIDYNPELLERARATFHGVDVIENAHARGASGARNTGYESAVGTVLVFLDDDTIAEAEWLAHLVAPLSRPEVLGTGGELVPLWRSKRPRWLAPEFDWVVGCTHAGSPSHQTPIRNPICANMSVRKSVYESVGGFEPALGRTDIGGVVTGTAEETEFCIRAQRMNPSSVWLQIPSARVQHVVPASRATWRFYLDRCRLEGASKAVLTILAGSESGLASERQYITRILPRAIGQNLLVALRGDRTGLLRIVGIAAGLLTTSAEYLRVRAEIALGRRPFPVPGMCPSASIHGDA